MRIRSSYYWLSAAIILGIPNIGNAQTFFSDSNKGWFFYESKPIESLNAVEKRSTNPTFLTPGEQAESELNAFKKQLNQAAALAMMYPTPDNVWAYQQLKTKVYNMSGVLTDQQMRNEWTRPDSYAATHATGGEGLAVDRYAENHCTEDMLRKGANQYGFYLFVSSKCKYCGPQINVLQNAQRNYGLSSMVVGFNGYRPSTNLEGLNVGSDNGMLAKKLGVKDQGSPVTVMLDTKTGQSQIIGYGYIPLDNLSNRICRLYTKKIGDF